MGSPDEKPPVVLVVDANPAFRLMARSTLEPMGTRVLEAGGAEEALAATAHLAPDLVLLDAGEGFALCDELRRRNGDRPLAVVIITERDDVDSIRAAYEAGATDFVTRPVNWLLLTHRLRYMLRMRGVLMDLKRSEERLGRSQRIAQLGGWEIDVGSGRLHCSPELKRLFGVDPERREVGVEALLARVPADDRENLERAATRAVTEGERFGLDHRVTTDSGEERFLHTQGELHLDAEGSPAWLLGTSQDVSERRRTEAQVRFLAYHDGLTQLANRRLFRDRLKQALAQGERRGTLLAVMFLDLDHFKRINDTYGHPVGDLLLQQVAGRLSHCVRESDCVSRTLESDAVRSTVSRLGGDEFMVLLSEIHGSQDAARVAQRILKALADPFTLGDREVVVGASLGVSLAPGDASDVDTLLRNADAAMYHAKESGRHNYKFYEPRMNDEVRRHLELEGELRRAIARNQFEVHYQPKVDVETLKILGFEALLRWNHPTLGRVPPDEFIGIAEQSGLIGSIGEWVLKRACNQARLWREAGLPALRVAVNLSPYQFKEDGVAELVARCLASSGLSPRYLDLEITESALMENEAVAVSSLEQLKRIGVTISLDDFGTGYSSLSYLKRFPVDTVKIDRSFIRDCQTDPDDAALTATIISMGRSLNLRVVAEGVETEEQRAFLLEHRCHEMQGYLVSPPVPAEAATALLAENRRR